MFWLVWSRRIPATLFRKGHRMSAAKDKAHQALFNAEKNLRFLLYDVLRSNYTTYFGLIPEIIKQLRIAEQSLLNIPDSPAENQPPD